MKAKRRSPTSLRTGIVRGSWLYLFEKDDYDRYSMDLLIPKTDGDTVTMMKECIEEASKKISSGKWSNPLKDGDSKQDTMLLDSNDNRVPKESFDYELHKGMFFIKVSSKKRNPIVIDMENKLLSLKDSSKVNSGDYYSVVLNFFSWTWQGKCGVSSELEAVKLIKKGEPFAKKEPSPKARMAKAFKAFGIEDKTLEQNTKIVDSFENDMDGDFNSLL